MTSASLPLAKVAEVDATSLNWAATEKAEVSCTSASLGTGQGA